MRWRHLRNLPPLSSFFAGRPWMADAPSLIAERFIRFGTVQAESAREALMHPSVQSSTRSFTGPVSFLLFDARMKAALRAMKRRDFLGLKTLHLGCAWGFTALHFAAHWQPESVIAADCFSGYVSAARAIKSRQPGSGDFDNITLYSDDRWCDATPACRDMLYIDDGFAYEGTVRQREMLANALQLCKTGGHVFWVLPEKGGQEVLELRKEALSSLGVSGLESLGGDMLHGVVGAPAEALVQESVQEGPAPNLEQEPFCPLFWTNMILYHRSYQGCCWAHKDPFEQEYFPGRDMDISTLFSSPMFSDARTMLASGRPEKVCPPSCPIYRNHRAGKPFQNDRPYDGYAPLRYSPEELQELPRPFQENVRRIQQGVRTGVMPEGTYPLVLVFSLGNACDLQCRMCSLIRQPRFRHTDHALAAVLRAMPYLSLLCLTGGEPFLFPAMKTICQEAKRHPQLKLRASTNGNLINTSPHWIETIVNQFAEINFSVDAATDSTHGAIRVNSELRNIVEVTGVLAERRRGRLPCIEWSFCLQRDNQDEVVDFVRLAANAGADTVVIQMMNYFDYATMGVGPEDDVRASRESSARALHDLAQAESVARSAGIAIRNNASHFIGVAYPDLAHPDLARSVGGDGPGTVDDPAAPGG